MHSRDIQPVVALFPWTVVPVNMLNVLAPLFRLLVLAPAGVGDEGVIPPGGKGLVQVCRPGRAAEGAGQRAAALVREWEQWLRDHARSGLKDLVKAGVRPPQPETFRSIMREIRGGRPVEVPTRVEADIFLHLVHIYDQQAAELEELLARAEERRRALEEVIRESEAIAGPSPEYKDRQLHRIPPVEYSFDLPELAPRRLAAWGVLAGACKELPRVFATTSTEALELLVERMGPAMRGIGKVALVEGGKLRGGMEGIGHRLGEVVGLLEELEEPGQWLEGLGEVLEEYRALAGPGPVREAEVYWAGGLEPHGLAGWMAGHGGASGRGSCVVLLVSQGGTQ